MYEVSSKIYNNILFEMKEVLDEHEYNYNSLALRDIIDEWLTRKQDLLEMFSKHPNWDAERLMVKFDTDFERNVDKNEAQKLGWWLDARTDIRNKQFSVGDSWYPTNLLSMFVNQFNRFTYIPDEISYLLESMNALHEDFRFRTGMKVTKVVRKICETYEWHKIDGFEKEYAKYCDAICPIKVTRHTCISLNPIDFLLMSNGNSWDSCHYIGDYASDAGCYSAGTISYMLDEHSFIFYTVSSEFDGVEIEYERKIQRQVFGYNDNQLLQSRLYPQSNDNYAEVQYTDIRNIVQKVVADCCEKPNLWVKRKVGNNVQKGRYATVYDDWYHFSSLCSVSVLKEVIENELSPIVMGAEPICIECGERHYNTGNISCCYKKYSCVCCGDSIDEDDVRWVGDDPCCEDCATWCDDCEHYDYNDNVHWLPRYDRYVCDDCIDRDYHWCNDCRSYIHEDDCTYLESEGRYVCDECLTKYYEKCSECGEWVHKANIHEVVDPDTGEVKFYCNDCNYANSDKDDDEEELVW